MSKDSWYLESSWSCRKLQRGLVYKEAREGNKILDIGTGMGRAISSLSESRKTVVGVDLDIELLREGRKINRKVNYVRASALYLPFKPESIDEVILENVIEHILEQRVVLDEVKRVLEEGGKVIISTPNKYLYRFFMYLRKLRDREFDKTWLSNPVPGHVAELTPSELRELLSNFKKLKIRGINPYLRSKNPWVGIDLLVVAVK
jgi:ubiquinone/menaquinone biosynthesis C-methylase UbiE